jgi:hypothetical protein
MVAAMRDARGRVQAVHCTYLAVRADGRVGKFDPGVDENGHPRPVKKMQGPAWGTSIRLSSPGAGAVWMPAEGIETGLSVLLAERAAGRHPCVEAAGSLGNLAGGGLGQGPKHPWRRNARTGRPLRMQSAEPDMARPGIRPPRGTRVAAPLFDGDGKDRPNQRQLEERACERWRREGLRVESRKPPPGVDFNDLLQGRGSAGGHHQDTKAPRRVG